MAEEKAPKDNRVPIMFSDGELDAIDEWRFANRISSRSEAIRRLCRIALIVGDRLDEMLPRLAEFTDELFKIVSDEMPQQAIAEDAWQQKLLDLGLKNDGLLNLLTELMELASTSRPLRTNESYSEAMQEAALAKVRFANIRALREDDQD